MKAIISLFTVGALLLGCQSSQSQNTSDMDTFKTPGGKEVTFHPIKHASMGITYDGREIQVDPVIDAVKPVTDYTQWPKADFILITHEHFDHLDKNAVEQLSKSGTIVVTNKNSAAIQTVTLDNAANPFSLISLLPVQSEPIHSDCFHFEITDVSPRSMPRTCSTSASMMQQGTLLMIPVNL